MKKCIFFLLAVFMTLFLNAQTYQEQIIGNWREYRMTVSFSCEGKTYSNIIDKNIEDKIGTEYTFYRSKTLKVNIGGGVMGTYRIYGNKLILDYKAFGHSHAEFPETIKSINSTTMVTETKMSDFVDKDDLTYFIETDGFKKEFAALVRSFAGKEITVTTTKYYTKK